MHILVASLTIWVSFIVKLYCVHGNDIYSDIRVYLNICVGDKPHLEGSLDHPKSAFSYVKILAICHIDHSLLS